MSLRPSELNKLVYSTISDRVHNYKKLKSHIHIYSLLKLSIRSGYVPIYWLIARIIYITHSTYWCLFEGLVFKYTLGKKGCYTPIEDNKTNVDRTFVFLLGCNWHDMEPWLFLNEIRHYLGQTFNARSSGIVELRNQSIGGRSPKSIFTLWQLWINICIFFQKFFWLCRTMPRPTLWV